MLWRLWNGWYRLLTDSVGNIWCFRWCSGRLISSFFKWIIDTLLLITPIVITCISISLLWKQTTSDTLTWGVSEAWLLSCCNHIQVVLNAIDKQFCPLSLDKHWHIMHWMPLCFTAFPVNTSFSGLTGWLMRQNWRVYQQSCYLWVMQWK
jgi:hypothetical protein